MNMWHPTTVKTTNRQINTNFMDTGTEDDVFVTVVIPMYNEVDNVTKLFVGLHEVMCSLNRSYEIIFVDDGSSDGTYDRLKELPERDCQVKIIRLRRNFGQTAAFSAGFDFALGEVVVTMDGDLQNDPNDIPKLLAKMDEGFDIVSGWRVNRQDKLITRRLPSRIANGLISWVTGVKLHDYGCSLKAYRSEVIKNLKLYGELHRFIPALAKWMGIRIGEVPVNHNPRIHGRSKYGLNRIIKVFLDLMTVKFLLDYATRPIQIFGLMGLIAFASGSFMAIYLTVQRLYFHEPLRDRPILLLAILLIVIGVQFITMGLLGELVIRTYHETQNKPIYVVRDIIAMKPENPVASEIREVEIE